MESKIVHGADGGQIFSQWDSCAKGTSSLFGSKLFEGCTSPTLFCWKGNTILPPDI